MIAVFFFLGVIIILLNIDIFSKYATIYLGV
nr:MAG TPA: hypothetical protein [Caudoviricetes sp.]